MKTLTKLSAIFLAATMLAAWPAKAQPSPTPPDTNGPPKVRAAGYRGTIASVDSTNMVLTLRGRGGNPGAKVKITHDTKIKKDGEPAQFSDAVEGLRVMGSGKKGDDGVWVANTLNISTKPPGQNSGATPKPPAQ
jgi:hypothetical protein